MERIKGYCDLCIPYNTNKKHMRELIEEAVRLGYNNVAIEQIYEEQLQNKANKSRHGSDMFPEPIDLNYLSDIQGNIKLFSRLTIVYSDVGLMHFALNSLNLRKYHILAARPTTEAAFNNVCSVFPCDLISLAPENTDVLVTRKNYNIAVRRGLFFEIQYSPAIHDSTYRKKIIANSHKFHISGKSRNVIISSGALNCIYLRGPYDIANLGLIFGLSEEQSKHAMLAECRNLLLQGEARRYGKTILFIKENQSIDTDSEEECENTDEEEDVNDDDEEMEMHPKKKKKMA